MSGQPSKSRSITDENKAERDLKTAKLKKQREAKEVGEVDEGLRKENR